MDSVKKKLSTGKIVCIVLIVILIAAAGTGGVIFGITKMDSNSVGKYFGYVDNEKVQNCWIELQKDNTWLNSEGLTGTYTKKGKTITLSGGGLAESMIGTIDGDKISFSSGSSGVIYGQTTPEGAVETEHNFIITLDAQGGTLGGGTTSVNAIYGVAMPTLVAPTKVGHYFFGYFDKATGGVQYYDATMTSKLNWNKLENITLYAQWADTDAIIFDRQGGTGGTDQVKIVAGEDMPSATAPTKVGYTFFGYFDSIEGGTQYYNADMASMHICDKPAGTILYARWTPLTYKVTLEDKGGLGGSESITATYGQPMPKAIAPTRENFFLRGYFSEATGGTQYYNYDMTSTRNWDLDDSAKTLYAVWDATTKGLEFIENADSLGYTVLAYNGTSTAVIIPTMYKGLPVTAIGNAAFKDNSIITSVTIPDSMITMGEGAFKFCEELKTVTFGTDSQLETIGKEAFMSDHNQEYIRSITSITIPDSVTTIGDGAFMYCHDLTTVTISADSKLKTIGADAFNNTIVLRNTINGASIDIPDGVTTIGDRAFMSCPLETITFGADSQLQTIGEQAFSNSGFNSMEIPNGVTIIEKGTFSGSRLTSITFVTDSKLNTIGEEAFKHCPIASIEIPAAVTTIGDNAFEYDDPLKAVTFSTGSKLETIGDSVFRHASFTSIAIPDSVTTIGSSAFSGAKLETIIFGANSKLGTIGTYAFSQSGLTSIAIPDSVTTIGERAFQSRVLTTVTFGAHSKLQTIEAYTFAGIEGKSSGLSSINIPDSVTTIKEGAFNDCKVLIKVTFGEASKLQTIGKDAFRNTNIGSIRISPSVTSIGEGAFSFCDYLNSITISDGVTSIEKNAFVGSIVLTIYAEAASKPVGWADGWNSSNRPVVWGVTLSEDKTFVVSYKKARIENESAAGGILAPYRAGVTLVGWSLAPAPLPGGDIVAFTPEKLKNADTDTQLYAMWRPIAFTIKYLGNENTNLAAMPDQEFSANSSQKLRTSTFDRDDGYSFSGWEYGGSNNHLVDEEVVSDSNFTIPENKVVWLFASWWLLPETQA